MAPGPPAPPLAGARAGAMRGPETPATGPAGSIGPSPVASLRGRFPIIDRGALSEVGAGRVGSYPPPVGEVVAGGQGVGVVGAEQAQAIGQQLFQGGAAPAASPESPDGRWSSSDSAPLSLVRNRALQEVPTPTSACQRHLA
jgi:hypothetical protein